MELEDAVSRSMPRRNEEEAEELKDMLKKIASLQEILEELTDRVLEVADELDKSKEDKDSA